MEQSKANRLVRLFLIISLVVLTLFWDRLTGIYGLGNQFTYYREHIYPDYEENICSNGIPYYVEKYNCDQRFIIAKQNPRGWASDDSHFRVFVSPDSTRRGGLYETYYWILDKYLCIAYGPMEWDMFEEACEDLEVLVKFD